MKSIPLKAGIGERLKKERKRLGYNQTKFAEAADVKRATQYLYEREEYFPNFRYFQAIAEIGADILYIQSGYQLSHGGALILEQDLLDKIYDTVDELARDENCVPLSLGERRKFFNILCTAYDFRKETDIDMALAKKLISKG